MGRIRRCLFMAALAAGACLGGTGSSGAQQRPRSAVAAGHDGVYAIHVVTNQGICDKDSYGTVTVNKGQVASPAGAFMQASGQISPRGVVALAFRRDNHVVNVAGRLTNSVGAGTWSSVTLQCAGLWSAVRHDRSVADGLPPSPSKSK